MTKQLNNVFITEAMKASMAMLEATRQHQQNRIGLILGQPGTGKTVASHWLVTQLGNHSHRICCHSGLSKKKLLIQLADAAGYPSRTSYTYDDLMTWLTFNADEHVFIIDEANHLGWQHMEAIRFLCDEAGATAILIGTELLSQTLVDRRKATFLAQLNSRIGGKTVLFKPIPDDDIGLRQVSVYFFNAMFGIEKPSQKMAKAFLKACKGNWRLGNELAEACQRLMLVQGMTELSVDIINAAAVHLANSLNT